jgi:hypothetical protein
MLVQIARAIPDAYSISFVHEVAYDHTYDYRFRAREGTRAGDVERLLMGPILLGRVMNRCRGFVYVGANGYLLNNLDQRKFEFSFIKKHSLKIVDYWCGSDIRSTRRMHQLETETGLPNISTYIGLTSPSLETDEWEETLRRVASVADQYADAMYSNSVDHLGYLTTPTEPFLYFFPDEDFVENDRFADLSNIVIVHATSSPIIKGTQLVRAAIAKLRIEGYAFEYVELIKVPNSQVRAQLARAHIAVNQVFGFSTAVFGAEALTAGCVVLQSADETIETDFAAGSNDAWVVTKHYQVYDNLKALLDNPERLEPIARRGQAWARKYASRAIAGRALGETLDLVLNGTYFPPGRPMRS